MLQKLLCRLIVIMICLALNSAVSGLALADSSKVLKVGGPWGPKTLDVQKSGYVFKRLGVVENLVEVDENLKLVPGLAKSWSVSSDKLTWTFKLRKGVKFHDGTSLSAGVLKSNLERLLEVGSILKGIPIEKIMAVDSHTLKLETSEPFAPLAAYMAMGETAALALSSFNESGEIVKPVGTGPFIFESWKVRDRVTTLRNNEYWGTQARVKKVVYKAVPDVVTRLAMFRAGDLDIAQILPPQAISSLKSSEKFEIMQTPIGRCRMAGLNMAREPFSDPRMRKAVNMAVNRQDLVKYVLDGVGQAAVSMYPPMIYWANDKLKGFAYDPEQAEGK